MSASNVTALASELRQATLGQLWRQWRAVGATVSSPIPCRTIVDPEVLILMSLTMLEHERRLADVVWSWISVNHALVSVQRLGNLRGQFPDLAARRLAFVAGSRVDTEKDPRWKSLQMPAAERLEHRPARIRAVTPQFSSWATLQLQLRQGMGVGAKADVLSFVLGLNSNAAEWASVSMIAESIGYTTTAVRRVAEDLAAARFIRTLEVPDGDGAARMFSTHPAPWTSLLGVTYSQPGWGYWRERFQFAVEVLHWLNGEQTRPTSPYAQDVAARKILTRHGAALRRDRIVEPIEFAGAVLGRDYLVGAVRALITWWANHG